MIAFDLDGTLIDLDVPIASVRELVRAFFVELGIDREMRPILAAITAAASEIEARPERAAELEKRALKILGDAEKTAAENAPLRPGVSAVAELAGPFAIVTNNGGACGEVASARLKSAGLDVTGRLVSRDDVAEPKPNPAGLLAAWDLLGRPDKWLWVGDSTADVEAGRRFREQAPTCALTIVGVRGGRNTEGELIACGADWVAPDLIEFARRLKGSDD